MRGEENNSLRKLLIQHCEYILGCKFIRIKGTIQIGFSRDEDMFGEGVLSVEGDGGSIETLLRSSEDEWKTVAVQ
jgi:hypothetical protein